MPSKLTHECIVAIKKNLLEVIHSPCAVIKSILVTHVFVHAFNFLGTSLATFSVNNLIVRDVVNFLISPMVFIKTPSCVTFQYFMRYHLTFHITNENTTTTLAEFHADGGFDFHQVWLDLPSGRNQLLWEIHSEVMDPETVVKNYYAAIDDIVVSGVTCKRQSKFCVYCIAFTMNLHVTVICWCKHKFTG